MDRITLKKLFDTSLYLNIIEIKNHEEIIKRQEFEEFEKKKEKDGLSTQSKNLLSYFSPETQKRLERDFHLDDKAIKTEIEQAEIDDPDYVYFDPKGVGIYLELWVCVNIPCPGCGKKLYKYANPNMPVVDVRCINPSHDNTMGPIYYQIKATEKDKFYLGYRYFSHDENYISTGSKKYGGICHEIRADDVISRDILIGYICIEYILINNDIISIDMNKSFVLIPNLHFIPDVHQIDLTYYKYIRIEPSPIVSFETSYANNMIFKKMFSELYKPFGVISLNTYYDAKKTYNKEPPAKLMLSPTKKMQYKYLIMKKKYLDLKNKIENST
jgi:hypothetical protein